MRYPAPIVNASSVTIPALSEVELVREETPVVRVDYTPKHCVLYVYEINTDNTTEGVKLQRFINGDPEGEEFDATALAGLDKRLELDCVILPTATFTLRARNTTASSVTLNYRCIMFYEPYEEEKHKERRMILIAKTVTLEAGERLVVAEVWTRINQVCDIYHIATSQVSGVLLFARLNGRPIQPVDGMNLGTSMGIGERLMLEYRLDESEHLEFIIYNTTGTTQTVSFRVAGVLYEKERKKVKEEEEETEEELTE
jgi:hypothetical protein